MRREFREVAMRKKIKLLFKESGKSGTYKRGELS